MLQQEHTCGKMLSVNASILCENQEICTETNLSNLLVYFRVAKKYNSENTFWFFAVIPTLKIGLETFTNSS